MKLKHMIILQNKIDLVKETQAKEQHEQILRFVKGLMAFNLKLLIKHLNFVLFPFLLSNNFSSGFVNIYQVQLLKVLQLFLYLLN